MRGKTKRESPGADALREVLEARGLSYSQGAEQLGVSVMTVWRWAAGQREPAFPDAVRIEKVFGVDAGLWPSLSDPISAFLGLRRAAA